MPAPKKCGCSTHDESSSSNLMNIKSSKKLKTDAVSFLRGIKFISAHCNYICVACYEEGLKKWKLHVEEESEPRFTFAEFIEKIKNNEYEDEKLVGVAESLGCIFKKKFKNASSGFDKSSSFDFDFNGNLEKMDIVVKSFLTALCVPSLNRKNFKILNVYEHLVSLSNFQYIGMFNFCLNLVVYYLSGSKSLVELRGNYSPAGRYSYVMNFLSSCASKYCTPYVESRTDCLYFFDNNQILARNWNVTYNSKALVSVITTLVSLIPPSSTDLQTNPALSPFIWLNAIQKPIACDAELNSVFRKRRNEFISSIFPLVLEDIKGEVKQPDNKQRRVVFDDSTPCFSKDKPCDNRYDFVPTFINGKTEVVLLDPVLVNPCSFQSLQTVLDNILKQSSKEWIVVGCDGLPYNLCCRLIENTYTCKVCHEVFGSEKLFERHNAVHPYQILKDCLKYKNILILPGLGHVEINLTKAIYKLLWDVVLKRLALMLGWRSLKALSACQSCSDHHKAWQILQIFLYGTAKSLVKPYVMEAVSKNVEPSVEGLYSWINATPVGANYRFMFKAVFTHVFALHLYRAGVRRGNFDIIRCAWHKVSPLFYGLNMTGYMEITYRFDKMMKCAPEPVLQFVKSNIALSQSGSVNGGEGGDFILENVNKAVKSWMPPGVPTEDRWIRVCRNLDSMEKVKDTILSASVGESQRAIYHRKLHNENEILYWERTLTEENYFKKSDMISSIDEKTNLDKDLIMYEEHCIENKTLYYERFPEHNKMQRLFITQNDREKYFDIENKSKNEIQDMIKAVLQSILDDGGDDEFSVMSKQWKKEKLGTKKSYIAFYKEAIQCLEDISGRQRDCAAVDPE